MLTHLISKIKFKDDSGSVSMLMLAVLLMTVMFGAPLMCLGGAVSAQQKLANSADLVAIGAANEFLADLPKPCEAAKKVAAQNHVQLLNCEFQNLAVIVKVAVSAPNFTRRIGVATLTARAKAGL